MMRYGSPWIIPTLLGVVLIGASVPLRLGHDPWDYYNHVLWLLSSLVILWCWFICFVPNIKRRGFRLFLINFTGFYICAAQALTPYCPSLSFPQASTLLHPGMRIEDARAIMRNWRTEETSGLLFPYVPVPQNPFARYETDGGNNRHADYRLRFTSSPQGGGVNRCDAYVRDGRIFAVDNSE